MKLTELAEAIGAELRLPQGVDAEREVRGCAALDDAGPEEVSFLANPRYAAKVATTRAAAVIVGTGVDCEGRTLLRTADPYFAFRNAVVALHGFRTHPAGNSSLAVIDPTASVGEGCTIHPFAVVSAQARVGKRCVLYPHTFIGPGAVVGDDCQLFPGVTVYDRCVLGNRVTLHAGTVIGQDGFGYATHKGAHHKIPQVGNAVVEDDVEMGANCSIDRATVGSTVIGKGTKFSDCVTIGHGCKVGQHNLYVALVGLAGSVETGDYVVMGGQVGVAGHLKIGHQAQIAATSGVMTDIPDKSQYGGTPAMPLNDAKRSHLSVQRIPDLIARVKQLEREVEKLRAGRPG
jgi:UDP-3-O-[3-hydroxymyristoyl] glucosamine N-acyltransferase